MPTNVTVLTFSSKRKKNVGIYYHGMDSRAIDTDKQKTKRQTEKLQLDK